MCAAEYRDANPTKQRAVGEGQQRITESLRVIDVTPEHGKEVALRIETVRYSSDSICM